ncbi:tripartite motif-containing protein 64-like [Microcebus murinus]|uniref:tripartite motif-containing protein 64-like n=1 Tax=Microcebus murinus TaxID=30608 RepID=UPI003F6CAC33
MFDKAQNHCKKKKYLRNMDSDTLQTFHSELICTICMNYFIDPVTIDCGHSFCRPCLSLYWEKSPTPMSCPECREISEKTNFKTNLVLKKLASLARPARPHQGHISEEQICVAHLEVKGLFCEADKTLLCGPCSEAPEHATHGHPPIEWAAEQCRDYAALRKVMIEAEYQKIHQFLHEEEQLHLETLNREAEGVFQQLRDSEMRMTQQKERMKDTYRLLADMCHKPDMELLQDMGNVLEWTKSVQAQKPQPVNPELTSWRITGLLDMLNTFRVDSSLSKKTASHYMRLSEDVRSVIFGAEHYGVPVEPQRAKSLAAWGAQTFTTGRHYWEVDVTHYSSWVLGVCKDSWTRDNNNILGFEEAYFLFSLKRNNLCSISSNSPPLALYVQRPLGRVGVFLDYDNATVSFYDVCKSSLIYSFFPSSFSSPLKPFLCLGSP